MESLPHFEGYVKVGRGLFAAVLIGLVALLIANPKPETYPVASSYDAYGNENGVNQ
jgi:hypothetical protein